MSPARRKLFWSLTVCLLACPIVRADFDPGELAARPAGMGGAFTALAEGAEGLLYNPAGIGFLQRSELTAGYARLLTGLDDRSSLSEGLVAFAIPLRPRKSISARVRELNAEPGAEDVHLLEGEVKRDLGVTPERNWGAIGGAFANRTLSGALSENRGWIGYGRAFGPRLSVGATLKLLHQIYELDDYTRADPLFATSGRSLPVRLSADAGLLANLSPGIFWGVSATDLNRPDIALGAQQERLPVGLASGLAYRSRIADADVDVTYRDTDYRVQAGAERWFDQTFAARLGGGFGSRDQRDASCGISVRWKDIRLDYAFVYPFSGLDGGTGSHRLSFTVRFGRAPDPELAAGSLEYYYARLKAQSELMRARLEKSERQRMKLEQLLEDESRELMKSKLEGRASAVPAPAPAPPKIAPLPARPRPAKKAKKAKPEAPPRPKFYKVKPGDTLDSIARKIYGDPARWKDIYNANPDKVERGAVAPGQVLQIP